MKIEVGKSYKVVKTRESHFGRMEDIKRIEGEKVKVIHDFLDGDFRISDEKGNTHVCQSCNLKEVKQLNNNITIKESVIVEKRFKIGDSVRIINKKGILGVVNSVDLGDTAVIEKYNDENKDYKLRFDVSNDYWFASDGEFELIEAAKDVQKLKIITEGTTTTVKFKDGREGVAKLYYKDTFNKGFGIVQALGVALGIDLIEEVLKVVKSYEIEDKPTKEEIKEFADRTAFKHRDFKVGDLVKGVEDSIYGITDQDMTKGEIIKVLENKNVKVKILEHKHEGDVGREFTVDPKYFELVKETPKFQIGCKVKIPKTKQGREGNLYSAVIDIANKRSQDHLFLVKVDNGDVYVLSEDKSGVGDYFNIEDLELYEEEAKVFKIGDIIKGTSKKFYPITDTEMTRAEVIPCKLDNRIRVKILEHTEEGFIGNEYNVEPEYFELVERPSLKKSVLLDDTKPRFKVGQTVTQSEAIQVVKEGGRICLYDRFDYDDTSEYFLKGSKLWTECNSGLSFESGGYENIHGYKYSIVKLPVVAAKLKVGDIITRDQAIEILEAGGKIKDGSWIYFIENGILKYKESTGEISVSTGYKHNCNLHGTLKVESLK